MVRGAVVLDGVRKRYHRAAPWVLDGVSLAVAPGAVVHVHGANGSGKTTLLRILAGASAPTAGRVRRGDPVGVGYVPERFPPALPLTPRRYLELAAAIRRLPHGAGTDRAAALLDGFGARDMLDTPMRELSKGTAQKVALAHALLGEPALLVLDEAFTGLDTAARETLTREVRDRASRGCAVVFTDHRRQADQLVPDVTFEVADGTVTTSDPARRPAAAGSDVLMRLVLTGGPQHAGWLPPAGIGTVTPTAEGLVVVAPAAGSDAVLTAALAAGLSVRRVEPVPRG